MPHQLLAPHGLLPRWRCSSRIDRRAANRAIYFDFEGRKNEPPALLGVYTAGRLRQFALDSELALFAAASRSAGERVFRRTLATVVKDELLLPARRDDRRLVAFSEHELRVLHRWAGPEIAQEVAGRYLNARDFLAAWVTRDHQAVRRARNPRALGDFADLCGFEWPDEFVVEPANALVRLRRRSKALARAQKRPDQSAMELWARLLGYNRLDCLATKQLVLHAIDDARVAQRARQRRT